LEIWCYSEQNETANAQFSKVIIINSSQLEGLSGFHETLAGSGSLFSSIAHSQLSDISRFKVSSGAAQVKT
jgi:hypothetical protein